MDSNRKRKAEILVLAAGVSLIVFEVEMMSSDIHQPANFERRMDVPWSPWAPHGNDIDFSPATVRDNFSLTYTASLSSGTLTVAL